MLLYVFALYIVLFPEGKKPLERPGVDGKIILRWILGKWDVTVWTGFGWLRIETNGGHL
jgi:hypothetical protein